MADLPIPAHLIDPAPLDELALVLLDHDPSFEEEANGQLIEARADLDRFTVNDASAAEWCGRKLAGIHTARTQVTERAAEWRAQITEWETEELARTDGSLRFFQSHLEDYGLRCRTQTGKATTTLPSVVVRTTKHDAKVTVSDEPGVVVWAETVFAADDETREAIVKTKKSVLLTGLRSAIEVGSRPTGRSECRLGCGCVQVVRISDERTLPCVEHGTSSIVQTYPEVELIPVYAGRPVDGLQIEPAHTTAKVTPR